MTTSFRPKTINFVRVKFSPPDNKNNNPGFFGFWLNEGHELDQVCWTVGERPVAVGLEFHCFVERFHVLDPVFSPGFWGGQPGKRPTQIWSPINIS